MDEWQYKPAGDHQLASAEALKSLRRESGLLACLTQAAWRTVMRSYLGVYHRLQIEGQENLPETAPFVMIANHSSHLDALTLASALPWQLRQHAFPIAAGDVFFKTQLASLFSVMMLNALPMWRQKCGSHAIQELRSRLAGDPAIYILFPEGTRTRDGRLGSFKSGVGMIVAASEVPVVPCHLEGAFAACPPGAKFPKPVRLRLRIGPPRTFGHIANTRAGWQEITTALETAVAALGQVTPPAG